jgi:hypothetical protein
MTRRGIWRGAAIAAAISGSMAAAQAGEVRVDKVPQVVLEAIKGRFATAKMTGAAKEKTEKDQEVYEISLEDENQNNIDVTVTPEGAILLIEQQIGRKELPAPVAKTLEAKYPKARYRIVEKLIEVEGDKETLSSYEVLLVMPDKKMWAVELDLEGKILLVEEKIEGEDD